MNIKQKVIRFLSPIRRIHDKVYSFVLAAYLGKIIILLGQIDHNILDSIFYFTVFYPRGSGIKEFYRIVSTQTMGKKLTWLRKIYKGDINVINSEVNTTLAIEPSIKIIIGNKTIKTIIGILDNLISDTRNPLVHSNYFLGYGNEFEWKLTYHRSFFDKKKNDFVDLPFTIKEAVEYLNAVQQAHKKLMKLFFQTIHETLPMT